MFHKIIYLVILIIILIAYPSLPDSMDKSFMVKLLGIDILCLMIYLLKKENMLSLKQNYLKHSFIFLVGFVIVHFQYSIDYVLGNVTEENTFIWINQAIVVKSLYVSTIGLVAFLWGHSLYNGERIILSKKNNEKYSQVSVKPMMFIAMILLFLYFYTANPLYLIGHYGSVSMGSTATYVILLFNVMVFAIIIQNIRNLRFKEISITFLEYVHYQGYFLLLLIGIYLLSVIISGDRGPIITFSIAYIAGYYFVSRKQLSLIRAGGLFILASFFISVLGLTRNLDKSMTFYNRLKGSLTSYELSNPTIMPQTIELAGSVRTLHTVVNFIPENHPYTYGRFQFQYLVSAIPFSNDLLSFLPNADQYRYRSSASFVTWIIQGENPTSGVGTTCVADLYVELGLVGVVLGMFFFGYFIRFAEITYYSKKIPLLFPHIFSLIYLCSSIYISRSSILFGFRTVVWIYIVLIINKLVFTRK